MRQQMLLWTVLGVTVLTGGCRKAPPPEDIPHVEGILQQEIGIYASFYLHQELLDASLQGTMDLIQDYVDSGSEDCFRFPNLNAHDVNSLYTLEGDPTEITSVGHAQLMEGPVADYEAAMLQEDWSELFPNTFKDYLAVDEQGVDEFLAGDKELCAMGYSATIDAVLSDAWYYYVNQLRRIPDWGGSGHSMTMLRGYMPEPAETNSDSATMELLFSMEFLIPTPDGEDTIRAMVNWSGLQMGDLSVGEAFGMACTNVRNNFTDFQDWMNANQ